MEREGGFSHPLFWELDCSKESAPSHPTIILLPGMAGTERSH